MERRILLSLISIALAASCLWLPVCPLTAAGAETVDIVVNKLNVVAKLSLEDIRKIFTCDKTTWPNGKHITVIMQFPGQAERAAILREVYKMNETDYSRYFLQAAFTGRIPGPPKQVSSPVQMKQMLAQNPWAIGYLKRSDVDESVRVILSLP